MEDGDLGHAAFVNSKVAARCISLDETLLSHTFLCRQGTTTFIKSFIFGADTIGSVDIKKGRTWSLRPSKRIY